MSHASFVADRHTSRVGLAVGRFKVEAQFIAETIPPPEATSEEAAHGRYLARTICAHCHGTDRRGLW